MAAETSPSPAQAEPPPSLTALAIRGSAWVVAGTGISQVARFASSLVLTRILYPEAFGQMLLVNIFIQGLHMFLDFSIGASIVQNKRGNEADFLRTAWTVQIIRGLIIWLCALALAWPASRLYGQPELFALLAVASFTSAIDGFHSTVLFTLNKNLIVGKQTRIEVGTQLAGILTTIYAALLYPSVWALLAGSFVASLLKLIVSHKVYGSVRMKICWDAKARKDLFHFGKWLLVSSVLGFIISRSDKLVLGFLGISALGVSSLAYNLVQAPADIASTLSSRILYPIYSRIVHNNAQDLRRLIWRARIGALAIALPPLCFLSVFGPLLIRLFYDARYDDATWMLSLLAGGAIVPAITGTISPVLLAVGDSFRFMILLTSRSVLMVVCMYIGGRYYGVPGIILSTAAGELLNYPVLALCARKYGVWLPLLDASLFVISFAVIGLGMGLHWMGYF